MEKTIKRGDIIEASKDVFKSERLKELFAKDPFVMLLIPVFAQEFERVIFGEEKEDEE